MASDSPDPRNNLPLSSSVTLRDVMEEDFPIFYEQQRDPAALHMAAFTSKDPADRGTFIAHWSKILADDTIVKKSILLDGTVVGHVACFKRFGDLEVTYWIGKEFWGRGLATEALRQLLNEVKSRPLYARAAADNIASIRVLEKSGFKITGREKFFANARKAEIEEVIMQLS